MIPGKRVRSGLAAILLFYSGGTALAQWVAFNDHAPGPLTHSNATRYHTFGTGNPTGGSLRNINNGTNLSAQLAMTSSGVAAASSAAHPAGGTPVSLVFNGFVDFFGSPSESIELAGGAVVTYTFSNLSTSKLYRFHGSAVRGSVDYTNRWTLCQIVGAASYAPAHSSTNVLTTPRVPALSTAQAALNTGVNHTVETGDYVSWDNIRPGANGTFQITARQYTGTVPGGTSNGLKAYALTGLRLEELSTEEIAPAIANQPANQTIFEGQIAVFTADATGNPLSYQWLRDGVRVLDATNRVFAIQCSLREDTGSYSFIVSNSLGSMTSSNATLTVVVPQIVEWGRNEYGQVTVPFNLNKVVMMAAGSWHGIALQADGNVIGWGRNDHGEINIPADVKNPAAIAAGFHFCMALMPDRTVRCWGDNAWGQCNVPPGMSNVVSIFPGYDHAFVLKADGTVAAWGRNNSGQLNIPPGLSNVVKIAASGHYSLALKGDGTVAAWGSYDRLYPVVVPAGLSNVVAIAASSWHTLALKRDGTIVAWGDNSAGQSTVPPGLTNVVAIAAGNGFSGSHSVALKADGTVVAWGYNNFNQSTVPVCVQSGCEIAASEYYTAFMNAEDATSTGPVLLGSPFIMGVLGRPMHHRFAIRNGPAGIYAAQLPPGLEMDPVTGILSGWPRTVGTFTISVSANGSEQADRSYTLIIEPNSATPVITSDPQSQIALVGTNVTFECLVSGPGPTRWQWYFNGTALSGQTNATLTLDSTQLTNAGTYRVFVQSPGGAAWSDPATLTVLEYPRFQAMSARIDATEQVFRVMLEALGGCRSVVIEGSTNLLNWDAVFTNDAPGTSFEFTNIFSPEDPSRFFRARGKID